MAITPKSYRLSRVPGIVDFVSVLGCVIADH